MSPLQRVLEPEVMDTAEEADAYDAMDHSEVNRLFVADFLRLAAGTADGARVLDVGTGPAHQPLLLAERDPSCRIVAIDAAQHMLAYGRRHVDRRGFGARILLVRTDAKRLPFRDGAFDAVLSNSIVHHLPDPAPAFAEMRRVVKRGGVVFVRDLHRPADRAELDRLVAQHAADADDRQRGLFRDSLHAAFTVAEVAALLRAAGLGGLRVSKTSDRHWTAEGRA
jgi:ubiquinone/menaquinone biosynthesis C-methylase UbiE